MDKVGPVHRRKGASVLLARLKSAVFAALVVAGCSYGAVAPDERPGVKAADPSPTAAATQPGTVRTRPRDAAPMVYVPSGEFRMGSDSGQAKAARELCRQYAGEMSISVCKPRRSPTRSRPTTLSWMGTGSIVLKSPMDRYRVCVAAAPASHPSTAARSPATRTMTIAPSPITL